jgi:polar amino acid transport system substrate-binding protein
MMTKSRSTRLAFIDPFPPFGAINKGESEGLALDILRASFARVHREVAFVPAPIESVLELLCLGKADGMAFMAMTANRSKTYHFSTPYILTGGALFVLSSEQVFSDLRDFSGRKVATPKKGPLFSYIRASFSKVQLIDVKDYAEAMKAVLEGRVDGAALNIHTGKHMANQLFPGRFTLPTKVFAEASLAVAVRKGDKTDLLEYFNKGLEALKDDGTYGRILDQWSAFL